jgi:hypothetical protein
MPYVVEKKPEQESNFDNGVLFPAGQTAFDLVRVDIGLVMAKKWNKGVSTDLGMAPHARFVYKDSDGDIWESKAIKIPENFAYSNPANSDFKSGFWKHLEALAGREFTDEDMGGIEIDLGEGYDTWESLVDLPKLYAKKDEPKAIQLQSVKVGGKNVLKDGKIFIIFSVKNKLDKDEKPVLDPQTKQPVQANQVEALMPYSSEPQAKKKKSTTLPV